MTRSVLLLVTCSVAQCVAASDVQCVAASDAQCVAANGVTLQALSSREDSHKACNLFDN